MSDDLLTGLSKIVTFNVTMGSGQQLAGNFHVGCWSTCILHSYNTLLGKGLAGFALIGWPYIHAHPTGFYSLEFCSEFFMK